MAPAQIPVFLSQKPITENGQFRVVVLRLAWLLSANYLYCAGRRAQGDLPRRDAQLTALTLKLEAAQDQIHAQNNLFKHDRTRSAPVHSWGTVSLSTCILAEILVLAGGGSQYYRIGTILYYRGFSARIKLVQDTFHA